MDREVLTVSTLFFGLAMVRTAVSLRAGNYRPAGINFFAIALGFIGQCAFLFLRGHLLGRCPITNLFEVFIFLAWSVTLIYLVIGPAYRLSLLGAFTAPLVFLFQTFALLVPIDRPQKIVRPPNEWLEFHASVSLVAYGAFGLAGVAGLMYLVQERRLKKHQLDVAFFHFPPLMDLFAALTRLLWLGFFLYTAGLVSGFFTGHALPYGKIAWSLGVWILYAAILLARQLHALAPHRIAALCVVAFSAALTLLWGISFLAQNAAL